MTTLGTSLSAKNTKNISSSKKAFFKVVIRQPDVHEKFPRTVIALF